MHCLKNRIRCICASNHTYFGISPHSISLLLKLHVAAPSPSITDLQLYSHMLLLPMLVFGLENQQDEMQIYVFAYLNNVKSCDDERSRACVKVTDDQVASWKL